MSRFHRRIPTLLPPLLAVACAQSDPMRYIPQGERNLLQAEARLGDTPGRTATGGRISVDELLARARTAEAGAGARQAEPLVLRFTPGAVQPDAAQREAIERFAARAAGAPRVVVVGRRAATLAGPEALLGQRRAVAVARLLEPSLPEVETRFEPGVAADEILLVAGGGAPR